MGMLHDWRFARTFRHLRRGRAAYTRLTLAKKGRHALVLLILLPVLVLTIPLTLLQFLVEEMLLPPLHRVGEWLTKWAERITGLEDTTARRDRYVNAGQRYVSHLRRRGRPRKSEWVNKG